MDSFLRVDLNEAQTSGSVPRREWDLIEFYKLTKQKYDVVTVTFDVENHTVEFGVREQKK